MRLTFQHSLLLIILLLSLTADALAGSIERVVKLEGESGEGLEFRTSGTILVSKKSNSEFLLSGEAPITTNSEYRFSSGVVVRITSETKGTRVLVTGASGKPINFSSSARGWLLRWGVQSSPSTATSPKKEGEQKRSTTDQEVSAQATHFVNLLRSLAPRGNNPKLVEQARNELALRKFDEAIRILETAVKDTVYRTEAYQLLAEAYRAKGDTAKFRGAWEKYVEAARINHINAVSTDSIVSLLTYNWPDLSTLPPLELPEDLKDLVIPMPPPRKPAVDTSTAPTHQPPATEVHEVTSHVEPTPGIKASHQPENVTQSSVHADSSIHHVVDTVTAKPGVSEVVTPVLKDSNQAILSTGSKHSLLIPILITAFVTAIGCFLLFIALQKIGERRRMKQELARPSQRDPVPVFPVSPPSAPVTPAPSVEPSQPEIPSGMPSIASAYALHSTLTNPEPNYASEEVVGLDNDEIESIEQDDGESNGADSKRQMIYELDASGLSAREIAQKLGIGQDEVRTFLSLRKG
ncbi:MAG: hypothetical protein OEM52_02325 [bacterium]|nr:hypothetical protein [bacterium]